MDDGLSDASGECRARKKRIGIATSKVGDQKFCLDGSTD